MQVVVVGAGAAGVFAAVAAAEAGATVLLLEKTAKPLAKVRVSGGGRCNVTHACFEPAELVRYYPRGGRELRGPFTRFGPADTVAWFEARGVRLKTEGDGRMFPVTDRSDTVVDCLLGAARGAGVQLRLQAEVQRLQPVGGGFRLQLRDGQWLPADRVVVASGGSPKASGLDWLAGLGHAVVPPVPSLFTFNLPAHPVTQLAGISVPTATVRLPDAGLAETGPLLVTHWGLSGPAVLKLSAWAARALAAVGYRFPITVDWLGPGAGDVTAVLAAQRAQHGTRRVAGGNPFGLPQRLWGYLVQSAGIPGERTWAALPRAERDALAVQLTQWPAQVAGKTTFKEEFVTAGGVALPQVDFKRMESRVLPGLHFAGEVLDVDGVTGGFNFQAAWTTGYLAGAGAATG